MRHRYDFYGLKVDEVEQPVVAGIVLDLIGRIEGLSEEYLLSCLLEHD